MHPILFKIGPIALYSYGLMVALGFLAALAFVLNSSAAFGLKRQDMFDAMIIVLAAGIAGGRLLHVALNWGYYAAHPAHIIMVQEGGMAVQGGIALGVIALAVTARIKKMPFWPAADLVALYTPLAQAFGRIGCFLNGCCYGKESVQVPVQLVDSACMLLLFAILKFAASRKRPGGQVLGLYLILYSLFRFVLEFLRGDNPAVYWGLTLAQVISIALFLCGVIILLIRNRMRSRPSCPR